AERVPCLPSSERGGRGHVLVKTWARGRYPLRDIPRGAHPLHRRGIRRTRSASAATSPGSASSGWSGRLSSDLPRSHSTGGAMRVLLLANSLRYVWERFGGQRARTDQNSVVPRK